MRNLAIAPCLLLLAGSLVMGDVNPEKLATFVLGRSAARKGFSLEKEHPQNKAVMLHRPPQATAALNARYYHGPSELNYSVLLFPTNQALVDWDAQQRFSNPGWSSPLKKPERNGIRESDLGGPIRETLPRMRAVLVNRVIIIVGVHQHEELIRRNPELAAQLLPDKELSKRQEQVRAELIRLAKAFPDNKEP